MKLYLKGFYSLIGSLALTGSVFASHAAIVEAPATEKVYLGIFGGGGSSDNFKVDQYGSAFFPEEIGGPLAVDAFGRVSSHSAWFVGAQLGYQTQEILLPYAQWSFLPAVELEGFYIGSSSFNGTVFNNTSRLPEHNFDVTYPMTRSVFLTNAVLTFNRPCLLVHPYLGLGIGGAIARISGADSLQVAPVEAGVNHYNSNTSDMDATFAGQIKLGLSYDITKCVSVFAEYRWLYIGPTHFVFGSTVYPAHAETSSWQVKFDPQRYNLGSVGIRVNL